VLADRIAIINKGKITAIGSPQDLISKHGGRKILVIRKGGKKLADTLQEKYGDTSLNHDGDVIVKVDDVKEMWLALSTLTDMKMDKEIEIQAPTIEDVFLKVVGARITEEGELK
jgi:ABC-2 type transport system ATP-binding protein